MGIPAVAGLSLLTKKIASGDKLLVDGDRGIVTVNPSQLDEAKSKKRMEAEYVTRVEIRQRCKESARTLDGSFVQVMANVGCLEDAHLAQCNGADGIGLYRLEQLFLSRKTPPTRQDLIDAVKPCATVFADKPVVVRLLDAGGDKDIPFLSLPAEDNPSLGRRGVRLLLDYPDLAGAQIEAIVWLAQEFDVRILVPMVTVADDISKIRDLVQHAVQQIGVDKAPFLGAMIETPAAALCTREIAQNADFLSIGTNDLTQYTMAVGRENQFVVQYFLEDHPAVTRLIQMVVDEADGTPVEMCGELAGHTEAVSRLVGMGIHTFSVAPSLVPLIKDAVRQVSLKTQKVSGVTQSENH
jgi:phosphoenolpyruvate-protein kinase (PTS system EI component)